MKTYSELTEDVAIARAEFAARPIEEFRQKIERTIDARNEAMKANPLFVAKLRDYRELIGFTMAEQRLITIEYGHKTVEWLDWFLIIVVATTL